MIKGMVFENHIINNGAKYFTLKFLRTVFLSIAEKAVEVSSVPAPQQSSNLLLSMSGAVHCGLS